MCGIALFFLSAIIIMSKSENTRVCFDCGDPGDCTHRYVDGILCTECWVCTECWDYRVLEKKYRDALVDACAQLGALTDEKGLKPPTENIGKLISVALGLLEEAYELLD